MKTTGLSVLLVVSLIALASLLVHLNSESNVNAPNWVVPLVQGGEPKPPQSDEIPEKYIKTVRLGLEYLVKKQFKDGHWEGDGGKHPVAMTGLAGLALVMDRDVHTPDFIEETPTRNAKYSANISKAADWLMDNSKAGRDGLIFSEHPSETARYMEGHGLATLFLAGACRIENDVERKKKLTEVLARAVKYIVKAQSSQGGWYHTSKVEGHDFDTISVTAIQVQALQAAEITGIPVPQNIINDAQEYLRMALGKFDVNAKLGQNSNRKADIAAALASINTRHQFAYSRVLPEDELRKKWFKHCQTEIPVGHDIKFGRDELTHYYYAQAVYIVGGESWKNYRTAMFDHLQSGQSKDGSWPSSEGVSIGPVYSTAVWCTILQLEKQSHPSLSSEPIIRL